MDLHGRVSKSIMLSKEAQHQMLHIVWLHYITFWRRQTYGDRSHVGGCHDLGGQERELTIKGHKELFQGNGNVLYNDGADGYSCVTTYQNSLNYMVIFTEDELYLN